MEPTKNNAAILRALGLCRKAGKVIIGTDAVCEAVRGKTPPKAVFAANDNAENTDKKLRDKCGSRGVPFYHIPASGAELAHALGKSAHTAAVAVTDENLCQLAFKQL